MWLENYKKIVEKLVADSEASVEVMQRLNASFDQQSQQLDITAQWGLLRVINGIR